MKVEFILACSPYDESSKVEFLVMAVFKSLCGCVFSFCFRGVTQLNSSNPIGSASKTARFGASVFVKELIKDSI